MSFTSRETTSEPSLALHRQRVVRAIGVLAATGIALFIIGLLIGLFVVGRHGGGSIQGWDNRVENWMLPHRWDLVGASKVVAFLGDAGFLVVIAVALTVVLLVTTRSIRAVVPIVAYLGGEALVYLIRYIVHRPRPVTANFPAPGAVRGVHETSFSFPSGHAVAATAVIFAVLGTLALTYGWWWPWVVALVVSLFVIDTRLVLGVHWFSDVVFGLPLGVAWGVAVALVFQRIEWADLQAWLPGRSRRQR